jgi:hypothetical protein
VNFDQAIYSVLHVYPGLEAIKIRPDVASQGDSPPYVVYTLIHNAPNWTLTGPSTLDNAHYQVDVYATNRQTAIDLADMITRAITESAVLTGVPLAGSSGYEPDTKLYRRMLEFSVWLNA